MEKGKEKQDVNAGIPAAICDRLPETIDIQRMIREIRGRQVMIDRDLAQLYGVETKRLNEQVKRNIERFPDDFMFQLGRGDVEILKSQNATSSWGGEIALCFHGARYRHA